MQNEILIVDNGTQYAKLFQKALREMHVLSQIITAPTKKDLANGATPIDVTLAKQFGGVIVAGGKSSVLKGDDERPQIDSQIYTTYNQPVLGVCFGHQDMADQLGGRVEHGRKHCGPVSVRTVDNPFFKNFQGEQQVNATHNDGVVEVPQGFHIVASSIDELAQAGDITRPLEQIMGMYKQAEPGKNNPRLGVQFHPETYLTTNGSAILQNFVELCGVQPVEISATVRPPLDNILEKQKDKIQQIVRDKKIFAGMSGGVDSTVAMRVALYAGIPLEQIEGMHMDLGYSRLQEAEQIKQGYHDPALGWNFVHVVDESKFFQNYSLSEEELPIKLQRKGFGGISLEDAQYSEHKRILFQRAYAHTIQKFLDEHNLTPENAVILQGTNQADKVESGKGGQGKSGKGAKLGDSDVVKTHHNVGEIFAEYEVQGGLVEPLEDVYKPEIYTLAEKFGLPEFFSTRRPFPGPGLLIRSGNHDMVASGMYTAEQIAQLQEIATAYGALHNTAVQVTSTESVGVCGDERAVGVMAFLKTLEGEMNLEQLAHVGSQLPHYTTITNNHCITRTIAPLFDFDETAPYTTTPMKHNKETMDKLRLFDAAYGALVQKHNVRMVQDVAYVTHANFGQEGKLFFVARPWDAPDLMTGVPLIPGVHSERGMTNEFLEDLRSLKERYDFIANIGLDVTCKPIGGTEIN